MRIWYQSFYPKTTTETSESQSQTTHTWCFKRPPQPSLLPVGVLLVCHTSLLTRRSFSSWGLSNDSIEHNTKQLMEDLTTDGIRIKDGATVRLIMNETMLFQWRQSIELDIHYSEDTPDPSTWTRFLTNKRSRASHTSSWADSFTKRGILLY